MKKQKWFKSLGRKRFIIILILALEALMLLTFLKGSSIATKISAQVMTALSVAVALYIISTRTKGAYKLTWVFIVLIFPVFGGLFYLLFKFQSGFKKYAKKAKSAELRAVPYYNLFESDYEKAKKELPSLVPQIDYIEKFAGFPVYSETETKYLPSGEIKFEYLLSELKKAEKYIFLEYFIIQEGKMWDSILEILKEKAASGVTVRIIYDDMGCFLTLPKNYPEKLKKYGIDCVVFNPFRPVLTTVQNNRDHRKILVIDGKTAFTGGINLADEYINEIEKYGHWKDSSVLLKGKAVWSLTLIFLQMWEICRGEKEDFSIYLPSYETNGKSSGYVQPYADSPMDNENVSEHIYMHIINNAKKYVYITTPYLILDDSMISALCLAAKSGVDIRIITPGTGDKFTVHMTTRSYYKELISAGIKIYEYKKGFIHSKTFVSDDETGTTGTANLDFRSLYLNFECGVKMYKTKAIKELREDFLNTLELSKEITLNDCKSNIIKRSFQNILRLFAPLM